MGISNQKGFSLIEVLIAISLLSIITITVTQVSTDSIDSKDKITGEDRLYMQTLRVMKRVELDFAQIWSPVYFDPFAFSKKGGGNNNSLGNDFRPTEKFPARMPKTKELIPAFIYKNGALSFFTTSNRRKREGSKTTTFSWVQYSLQPSTIPEEEQEEKKKAEFELVRKTIVRDIYAPEFDWDKQKPQLLLRNVKSLKFEFWDPVRKSWVDNLDAINQKINKFLHYRLKMTLVYVDPEGFDIQIQRIFRTLWGSQLEIKLK